MKLSPKRPDPSVNTPPRKPLRDVALLFTGATLLLGLLSVAVVTAAEWAIERIDPATEVELFEPLLDDLLDTLASEGRDLEAERLIQPLFDRLVAASPHMPYTFTLRVSCSEVANAFAVPGGGVVVTAGLLRQLQSEEQLAFVLGHELGHFVNRDHLSGLGRAIGLGSVMSVVFSGAGLDPTVALELVREAVASAYSRHQEIEADVIGLNALRRVSEAHERAALDTLALLDALEQPSDMEAANFLRSHPLGEKRIAALEARMESFDLDADSPEQTPLSPALSAACSPDVVDPSSELPAPSTP